MKRCAYLTMEVPDGWTIDADLAFPFMEGLGWQIEEVQWRRARCDWSDFDAVYVGTPWDYPAAADQFIKLLQEIDVSSAVLINDYSLVKWNLAKTYLRDLESLGIAIVPALWRRNLTMESVFSAFDHFAVDSVIVKPLVSTNATDTFLLHREISSEMQSKLVKTFRDREFMLQPFISSIEEEGEYSLFYFGNEFSHAIQKVPKTNDFRVQEEFGADIRIFHPDDAMISVGAGILDQVDPLPAYARVDLVRGPDGTLLLMELELIEPSMYLRTNSSAPQRFAEAFDQHFRLRTGQ